MLHSQYFEQRNEKKVPRLISDLLSEAIDLLDNDQQGPARKTIGQVARLVANTQSEDGDRIFKGGLCSWQAERLRCYIDCSLGEELSLNRAAEVVGLSTSHLTRAFRVTFGAPFYRYVTQRRVERACRLMLTTASPLCEIALKCGFADQAHLCRQFRAAMDETPNAWRRRMRIPE